MKPLFELLPVFLFVAILRYAQDHKDGTAAIVTSLTGLGVAGIQVGANEAPVLLAIAAAALLTLAQAAWLKWRGQRIDIRLWLALALVMVLGIATVYFEDQHFHKWKPSALYWAMGLVFWLSQLLFGWNLPRRLLGEQLLLPARVWHRLNFAWVAFFGLMGLLNLWVAHSFSTNAWIDFSLFGGIGLVLGFAVVQVLFVGRRLGRGAASGSATVDSA